MCQCLTGITQLHIRYQQGGERGQQVGGIEAPQQRDIDVCIAPIGTHPEMQAALRQAKFFADHGPALETITGDACRPGLAFQLPAEGIVDIEHGPCQARPVE